MQKRQKIPKKCQKRAQKCQKVDTFEKKMATYTNFVSCSDSAQQTFFLFVAVIQCDKIFFVCHSWSV